MIFYTAADEERPIRLSEATRLFAYESMNGKYGDDAMKNTAVALDHIEGFENLSDIDKYDIAIREIAEKAPIRVCEYELVHGSASLGLSINHCIPATYKGSPIFHSVSHLTSGFDRVVYEGIDSYEERIHKKLENESLTARQIRFLKSLLNVIESMRIWHKRYSEVIEMGDMPFKKAENFKEAVQSLWFTFAFMRLCGDWPGIARIDKILGPYLKKDLDQGVLTLDEAREILASFFIKGCEWIRGETPLGSGDAQHYQNIILAGVDEDNKEVANEVTYLVLDIVEELGISDFPITVRVNENTDERLLKRVAEVIRHGGGIVAVYNEPLILNALEKLGYDPKEARKFANDGCWEVQIPGETYFCYVPFDALQILLTKTLNLNGEYKTFDSFEDLYNCFIENLRQDVNAIYENVVMGRFMNTEKGYEYKEVIPCSVTSLFTKDCIEKASSYYEGGPRYTVVSPHIGGAPDVGNSLYAIKRLVFDDKIISFDDLMKALKANWEGYEVIRQIALNKYVYYGNDDDNGDYYTVKVLDDFADIVNAVEKKVDILFPAGISTFGRQIEWAPFRAAVPFGYRKGDILSGNASPTPGTDELGATATIKSYCKIDHVKQACGSALDIKLYPATVKGENGTNALVSLIKGFVKLGGFFMQIDVVDANVLKRAQENPKEYKTLSVRVSGWNARFVTLNKEWQNMIIERTTMGV
ncbi:MAG TPA: pyruvate formate lyase family protein [Clostridia bacterium]|nr:pyruvate formate lyase family protein [Clostridia bacterium]